MKNTNIYFPSNSESFRIQKIKQIEINGFWRVEDKSDLRNTENFPYDIWNWVNYNKCI